MVVSSFGTRRDAVASLVALWVACSGESDRKAGTPPDVPPGGAIQMTAPVTTPPAASPTPGTSGNPSAMPPQQTTPSMSGAGTAETAQAGSGGQGAPAPQEPEPQPQEPEPQPPEPMLEGNFSFFVTSIEAMRELSGSQDGFGGDLGGLSGADEICQTIAAGEGAGHKTWRAFLSATDDGNGNPVHAIERIGQGPWYDRNGRLVAMTPNDLTSGDRPAGDPAVAMNLPNERGEPLNQNDADDHDVITGSNAQGRLASTDAAQTCQDWTSAAPPAGGSTGGGGGPRGGLAGPMLGHAWPAFSGMSWIQAHPAPGCTPGVELVQNGPPAAGSTCIGCGGGYGGIYCFALTP